jgi:hypothetical protein
MNTDPTQRFIRSSDLHRRAFLSQVAAGTGLLAAQPLFANETEPSPGSPVKRPYTGPNVILIRFGGGVRRRETIDPEHTYAPFFCHDLAKRGTLFNQMEIASLNGVETSHGQGTLYILTGKYDRYKDVAGKFLGERFEAKVPTVFEYLRKQYDIPDHQTLIINGEDRTNEEFYTFSRTSAAGEGLSCSVPDCRYVPPSLPREGPGRRRFHTPSLLPSP